MRFVTLNLDVHDARIIRQSLAATLAGCPCRAATPAGPCHNCVALQSIVEDLDQMLARAADEVYADHRSLVSAAHAAPRGVEQAHTERLPLQHLRLLPRAGEG